MKSNLANVPHRLPESISDKDFAEIIGIALKVSGISIDPSKRPMIYSRFSRRLRELRLNTFAEYIDILKRSDSEEYTAFINTVTTNLTYFFREPHHFDFLKSTVIPALQDRNSNTRQLRIWSSACSSGQEAYSIAMILAEQPALAAWSKRILATDIDTNMVESCATGCYIAEGLRGLKPEQQSKWLQQNESGKWQVKDKLRDMLLARQLNLFSNWPFNSGVDIIFCRNAMIYFDDAHQRQLIKKFSDFQSPGAYLFLGHSESIKSTEIPYKRVSNTVYERY